MKALRISGPTAMDWDFIDLVHPGDTPPFKLRALQKAVGGLIECISLGEALDAWINEEGKLLDLPPTAFWVDENGVIIDVIQGPIICLRTNEDGDCTPIEESDLARVQEVLKPFTISPVL